MCGIVGCIGLKDPRKYIIDGLKTLDYRGYDSAGLAFLLDDTRHSAICRYNKQTNFAK